ncbi:organic Anion Transporter Polypeptide family protein, partial [Teladorsagia circumcincta]
MLKVEFGRNRTIACFFVVFGTVYFLESIGGFYMTSAVVFIEKQFQIPSRLSGTMVSAGDFAYIPIVVFTSYFGGKGNRARWIGGGCMLIAIANLLIASSNFLFPVEEYHVNSTYIPSSLAYEVNRFVLNVSTDENWFNRTLREIDPKGEALGTYIGPYRTHNEEFVKYQSYCFYNPDSEICSRMEARISKEHQINEKDVSAVRVLTSLPYSFCHNIINKLRQDHKTDECKKEHSSSGPFMMIFGGLMLLGVGRPVKPKKMLILRDKHVKRHADHVTAEEKISAGTGVVGFACGVITGSVAMRKFHLQGRKAATWVAVCSLVAALLSFANGFVGCKSVIGQIGDQGMDKGMPLTFTECECSGTRDLAVSRDYCPTEHCNSQFHMFFFNQAMGAVFGGLSVVPGMLIVLRSVPPEHRSISLGFNGFLVSLLATLPSPVFWGKIFDLSCLMWQNICSKTGACPIYDTDQLRIRLHAIYGGLRLFSLLSDIWVIYWAKGLKL